MSIDDSEHNSVTLIGAGLVGSLLSIYLAREGFIVDIYEHRADSRKEKISAGRSINLALSTRGIHGLKIANLDHEVMSQVIPMKGRLIHNFDNKKTFQPYGQANEAINSVSRGELNKILLEEAEKNGVKLHFNSQCVNLDLASKVTQIQNSRTEEKVEIFPRCIIGTDGSGSIIRSKMQKAGYISYSEESLNYGYKELTLPAGPLGDHLIEKNALHIWPRKSYMLIALPNIDGTFTCTLFYPQRGENSFEQLTSESSVQSFFESNFSDVVSLIPKLKEEFFLNPIGNLVMINCWPWHADNKALILGDAAHAIVPFYGQGMNCGFEDCTVLMEKINEFKLDWQKIFSSFDKSRKKNVDAISELSLQNFIEMRDSVISKQFQLKKQIERLLTKNYPNQFISTYSMISFSRLPYAEAHNKGKIQDKILIDICSKIKSIDEFKEEETLKLLKSSFSKKVDKIY